MARKTRWKALTRSQKKKRRYNRSHGLLLAIFGKRMDCCTLENPCSPQPAPDDWINNFIKDIPYLK